MDKTIFLVMYAFYSDWDIHGYFTTRDEAEKYVVSHPSENLNIFEIACLDNQADLSKVSVKYEFSITFDKTNFGWECRLISLDNDPDFYQAPYLRSNSVWSANHSRWITVNVNLDKRDKDLAKKIAQDIFYQYMNECNGHSSYESMNEFNKILSAEEDAREATEKEEKLRKKELEELERLKAKYGN